MYKIECPYCEFDNSLDPEIEDYTTKSEHECSNCEKTFFASYDPIPDWNTWTKEDEEEGIKNSEIQRQKAIDNYKKWQESQENK